MNESVKNKTALSPRQEEAVRHGQGPLLISAGAGSGKTRTLTQRLTRLIENGTDPEKIVAITFTNKAANEIKERVRLSVKNLANFPFLGTFHSFGARILRNEARLLNRDINYVIFDNNDSLRLVKKIIKSLELSEIKYPAPKIQKKISSIKDELVNPDELEETMKTIFETYENKLKIQNAFDFDDLIEKVVRILQINQEVLQKYQNKFEYILVDEFQDINSSQYALVKLLANKHRNLNVVGDDNQSIYGFRGADFRNFLNFEKDWPEAKIVNLGENYRSTKNIVQAASEVVKNNKLQRPKNLYTPNDEGDLIKVLAAENADDEASQIINNILDFPKNTCAAILYRTNAQSRPLEQALNFNSIPYEIFGGLKFYERKEIKDIVAGLRYGFNPRDEMSLERITKTFRKAEIKELKERLPELAKNLPPIEIIGFFMKTTNYENHLKSKFDNSEERMENVIELINFASSFSSLQEFIERVSLLQATDDIKSPKAPPRVKLMTIHLSKGLEFDNVYIVGVNEGILPHQRSLLSSSDIEEERRLMYVAMTRARKKLALSFYNLASRFLHEIPPELIHFSGNSHFHDEDEIHLI